MNSRGRLARHGRSAEWFERITAKPSCYALLVLGATGGTGRHVVDAALDRGFEVTAFVRNAARLPMTSEHLHTHTGDVTGDDASLTSAFNGQDAVICVLGVGKSFTSGGVMQLATPRILRAMDSAGVRRIIFTSAFGIGQTWHDTPMVPRLFIRTLLRDVYRDKEVAELTLRGSSLDWTIVYPTGLTDRPATGKYRVGERLELRGFPTVARADVADFLVNQVNDNTYVRKGVLVSS